MNEPTKSLLGKVTLALGLLATAACSGNREAPRVREAPVCALATTRTGGDIVPAEAVDHLRAFVHPPPSQAHAERMVLIAAAYAMSDTGRLPSWKPADVLATFRAASREVLPRHDAQEGVAYADALIAEHLIAGPGCDPASTPG